MKPGIYEAWSRSNDAEPLRFFWGRARGRVSAHSRPGGRSVAGRVNARPIGSTDRTGVAATQDPRFRAARLDPTRCARSRTVRRSEYSLRAQLQRPETAGHGPAQ